MKKALLLAGLLATQFTFAQQKMNSLEVEISAGTALGSLFNVKSPFAALQPRAGVQVGFSAAVSAGYRLGRHFGVRTALLYEEKGVRVKAGQTTTSGPSRVEQHFSRKVDNDYLTLPFLLTWESTGKLGFGVRAGGFASLLIKSGIRGFDSRRQFGGFRLPNSLPPPSFATGTESRFVVDAGPRTNRVDYGGAFGGSLFYTPNDKLKLTLNALLLVSLRKLDKTHDNDEVIVPRNSEFARYQYDYFGLNSRASHVSLPVHLGLSYRLF